MEKTMTLLQFIVLTILAVMAIRWFVRVRREAKQQGRLMLEHAERYERQCEQDLKDWQDEVQGPVPRL